MCIGGISTVLQMAVLNCYHVYPLRKIPGWLKKMQACMSCDTTCAYRSRENEMLPYPNDNGNSNKHVPKTGDRDVNSTNIEDENPPTIEKGSATRPKRIIKEIRTEGEEDLRLEWKKLAGYCDRLLFFIFAAIHIFIILFVFGAVSHMYAWDALSSCKF